MWKRSLTFYSVCFGILLAITLVYGQVEPPPDPVPVETNRSYICDPNGERAWVTTIPPSSNTPGVVTHSVNYAEMIPPGQSNKVLVKLQLTPDGELRIANIPPKIHSTVINPTNLVYYMNEVGKYKEVLIQVKGTFTGTINVETAIVQTNYSPPINICSMNSETSVTSITTEGWYKCECFGQYLRVRALSNLTGEATINIIFKE